MFRLTREVRFAVNALADDQLQRAPSNSYAGFPSLNGIGAYLSLQVTLSGPLDPSSGYLRNIKQIDQAVREVILSPALTRAQRSLLLPHRAFAALKDRFDAHQVDAVRLCLSPLTSLSQLASEFGMYTRLSQKFEFSASHRLHNPQLSNEQNRQTYGKCNSINGHGHNYEVQVTLRGRPNDDGLLVEMPAFERVVKQHAIDLLDHKHLNLDVPQFAELIPTVENIAMVIYQLLKQHLSGLGAELASVTVWETPKTWCEYSE
jgi:6-pyruvoyltetrahydropterin/6-carboxytetrahydropterin synthase